LLGPDGGRICVEGIDPARQGLAVRERVGYLAEDQRSFGWMTAEETIRFTRAFYPGWDDVLAAKLARDFDLPLKTRVSHLSKGQNVRLGLLLAMAHRPPLVILDDPTLGLDPIMRKEFMRDVIDHFQGNGTTVFFSSHLLYEIEPVADEVAILDGGRIVRQAPTEQLRAEVRQFVVSAEDFDRLGAWPGALDVKPSGRRVAIITERADEARARLAEAGGVAEEIALNLDEIFEAYVIGNRGERRHD
jgi:ABC-2 type transport system ATP-binding protein